MFTKVLIATGSAAAVALLAWGALHVVISPVHPDQPSPDEHAQTACWACHFVSTSAELIED